MSSSKAPFTITRAPPAKKQTGAKKPARPKRLAVLLPEEYATAFGYFLAAFSRLEATVRRDLAFTTGLTTKGAERMLEGMTFGTAWRHLHAMYSTVFEGNAEMKAKLKVFHDEIDAI